MSVNLIGVTAMGGLPLFARHKKMCDQPNEAINDWNQRPEQSADNDRDMNSNEISFSRLAALNGVNLFSRLNDSDLLFCSTKDSMIEWKVFKGSVVLIIIVNKMPDLSQHHLITFVDTLFDALVLMCGLNEILSQNIERLKRCLRHSYKLIDYLLNCFISNSLQTLSLITGLNEYSLLNSSETMSSLVESTAQLASTSFCSIFINHKLLSASKSWWTRLGLSKDALLITYLVNSMSDTDLLQTKEIPVYLPDNCPTSLSRLVVSQLSKGVVLCLLCAENPSLDAIETEIIVPLIDSELHKEKFSKYLKTEIQMPFTIDESIIGFIIVRKDLNLFTCFGRLDDKLNYLIKFIDTQNNDNFESYLINESLKLYFISKDNSQIFVLFHFNVSLNDMRTISNKTLSLIFKTKYIWP